MYFRFLGEKPFISGNSRRRFALPICSIPPPQLGSRCGGGKILGQGRLLAGESEPRISWGDRLPALSHATMNRSILMLGCMLARPDILSNPE